MRTMTRDRFSGNPPIIRTGYGSGNNEDPNYAIRLRQIQLEVDKSSNYSALGETILRSSLVKPSEDWLGKQALRSETE